MTGWLRRAGRGRGRDGSLVIWSVAEGRRGWRWREVVVAGEGIRSSLLLELDPDRRFSHLELSTAAGLLTLHPEGDGTLHGNAVTGEGLEHVVGLPWQGDEAVLLEGSSVCEAIASAGAGDHVDVLAIDLELRMRRDRVARASLAATDRLGLPALDDASTWPLELEE